MGLEGQFLNELNLVNFDEISPLDCRKEAKDSGTRPNCSV